MERLMALRGPSTTVAIAKAPGYRHMNIYCSHLPSQLSPFSHAQHNDICRKLNNVCLGRFGFLCDACCVRTPNNITNYQGLEGVSSEEQCLGLAEGSYEVKYTSTHNHVCTLLHLCLLRSTQSFSIKAV